MAIPRNLANIAPHVAGSSGGITGLTFNATQSASAGANTLDDYEEGTFTPTLRFGGNSVGITYNVQLGRYTKIGRLVTVSFTIRLTSKGSSSGDASITLPFASDEYAQPNLPGYTSYIAAFRASTGLIVGNASAAGTFFNTTTNGTNYTNSDFTDSTAIAMTISYNV